MARATPQKNVSKLPQTPVVKFWQSKHFTAGLIFFAAFLLFANSISGGYNLDDELVTINHRLTSKGISAIPEIFTSHYYSDDQGYSYEYRPLVLASFAIEHQFFGDNAHVSHFFNVLLYAICCLVLLKVLLKVFQAYTPLLSVAITLLFVVHPSHTEVVSSIKNRDEILGLLFALLTLWAVFKSIETSRKWWFILVPVLFALALMGKATVIPFIFIIPLALIFFTNVGWRKVLFITALLTLPSFFLLNLSSAFIKILLLVGVMGLSIAVYFIFNFDRFGPVALAKINALGGSLFSRQHLISTEAGSAQTPFRLKNIFSRDIIPAAGLFSLRAIILTAALCAAYLACIAQFHSALAIVPLAVLLILAYKGDEKISWWATIMIGLSLTLNIAVMHRTAYDKIVSDPYSDLVVTWLALQILYGKRNMFIPILLTLIIFTGIHFLAFAKVHVYYLILLLIINEPYVIYAVLCIHLLSPFTLGRFSHHGDSSVELIRFSLQIVTVIWIMVKKGIRVLPFILLFSAIALFHFSQFGADRSFQPGQTLYSLEQASNILNPQIIAAPQDRPLNFAEESIDSSSSLSVRLGTSFQILVLYAYKAVVPYPLSFYYGFKFIYPQKISEAVPIVSLIFHLLLFITAVWLLKKEPLVSFGLLLYLVSIAIFANYLEPVPGMFGDRFLLIPSLGWAIILVVIIQKIFRADISTKTTTWLQIPVNARYAFAFALLIYSCLSFSRNMDWHDDITLMRHDINVVPQSVQAQNLLGIHLLTNSFSAPDAGQQTALRLEAVEHIKKANALYPGFFNYNYDLGRAYMLLNMPDSALTYFKAAAIIDTTYRDVLSSIATIYLNKGDYQAAIPYCIRLIQKNPNDYPLYAQLSYAYFNLKQFDLSIQTNQQAIRHFPNQVQPYVNIATAYTSTNNNDSAKAWLNRALIVSPGNPDVINHLKAIK